MSRRWQENIVAAGFLLLFVGVLLETMNYGPRASMVPNIIAGIGAALMLAQLILQNVRSQDSLQVDLLELISARATGDEEALPEHMQQSLKEAKAKKAGADAEQPTGMFRPGSLPRELMAIGVVCCAIGLFFLIGPIPTMFVFTFSYLTLTGHFGVMRAFLVSSVFTLFVYGLFHAWLRIDMDKGLFDLGFGLW